MSANPARGVCSVILGRGGINRGEVKFRAAVDFSGPRAGGRATPEGNPRRALQQLIQGETDRLSNVLSDGRQLVVMPAECRQQLG
jgi:hypothetical protein